MQGGFELDTFERLPDFLWLRSSRPVHTVKKQLPVGVVQGCVVRDDANTRLRFRLQLTKANPINLLP